jgi:uncharacterized protein
MSMLLDVESIREPFKHIDRTDPPAAFGSDDAFRVVDPVGLSFDLQKERSKVRLVGSLHTEIELDCSRCLEQFRMPIAVEFDVEYQPAADAPGEAEREVAQQDLDTAFYHEGVIDLRELVREQLYLVLPMKPLCIESCAGLCPVCGTNLNTGSCDCSHEWEDPRLAPLKALARKSDTDA